MQIDNNCQKQNYSSVPKTISFRGQTIPIKQISEKGLSVASNALASMGIASIALANMNNQKSQENLFINEIDIQKDIEKIEDKNLSILLKNKYNSMQTLSNEEKIKTLLELNNLIDIYNNITGKYTTFNLQNNSSPDFIRFSNFCKRKNIKMTEGQHNDFEQEQKIGLLIDYCKKNNNEISNYLYEKTYINSLDITEKMRKKLIGINRNFGTKIFLPSGEESLKTIEYIRQEFKLWRRVSNNQAKYPSVLDLLQSKDYYVNKKSVHGKSASAGTYCFSTGCMTIYGYDNVEKALRHELMHVNDLKRLERFPEDWYEEDGKTVKQEIINKCSRGFQQAGAPSTIDYPFTNPKEFIATAAQGITGFCSQDFIDLLVDFGMPRWATSLYKIIDSDLVL